MLSLLIAPIMRKLRHLGLGQTSAVLVSVLSLTLMVAAAATILGTQVLRMATLTSAEVIGVNGERGVVAPGKLADMILIGGDPTEHIEDIHKIAVVIKSGHRYDPAQIEAALGIAPLRQ